MRPLLLLAACILTGVVLAWAVPSLFVMPAHSGMFITVAATVIGVVGAVALSARERQGKGGGSM
jgi:hypothetical protein